MKRSLKRTTAYFACGVGKKIIELCDRVDPFVKHEMTHCGVAAQRERLFAKRKTNFFRIDLLSAERNKPKLIEKRPNTKKSN
jgi:hypothetical protein